MWSGPRLLGLRWCHANMLGGLGSSAHVFLSSCFGRGLGLGVTGFGGSGLLSCSRAIRNYCRPAMKP